MNDKHYNDVLSYWKEHKKDTEADYNRLLSNFWLLNTCDSNNIEEGKLNYHVTREVFEGSAISIAGVYPRDIIEANNSKLARRKVITNLLSSNPITPDLIKSVHATYMNGLYDDRRYESGERPGKYKIHDYCVGISEEGSAPAEVENDMLDLCKEVYDTVDDRSIEVAAYFHLVFESIHPFSDGNGRVGRLMMNYLLMLKNHPPINIFSEDKDTYYMALEVFDRTGEISGFVKFLKEQCVKTWAETVKSRESRVPSLEDAISKMNDKDNS